MKQSSTSAARRGEDVPRLRDISRDGWKKIGKAVGRSLSEDHIPITSAGVAFFFFLAVFPALAAAVSVYALVQDPAAVQEQLSEMKGLLPEKGYEILSSTLEKKGPPSSVHDGMMAEF
jgi:membrane protein